MTATTARSAKKPATPEAHETPENAAPEGGLLATAEDPRPGLRKYLEVKRAALLARRAAARANPLTQPHRLRARTTAEERSGVRRIRIRHHQILSDSPLDFAGYDLGPASPEIQLGVLSSCLTHIFLIQAADLRIPLDSLAVEVEADQDPRAGSPGFEDTPIHPHHITYTVHVTSPAGDERIRELHEAVERNCPIYQLLTNPQNISGRVVLTGSPREL
ncbi:OsmC family protein [Streptomyces radicis]|uniref:OsmC family peroxiredoxin n=1 Tax=Streptomyces radicis TaxID=1750517 RepID=A0A3A9W666_9ACTN|nr:OsmC family protein [Streptomyces radicis]RKN08350.1 OsmC family peroxiredoxin [Streptomyces radicis]RKN21614.1 OsmC family peroxiredoxin [Streptomyces radicis]